MVHVHLFGQLRSLGPQVPVDEDCVVDVPVRPGDTITDVLQALGIEPKQVAHAFLNHEYSAMTRRVQDGDRLGVFGRDMALLYRQYFPKKE